MYSRSSLRACLHLWPDVLVFSTGHDLIGRQSLLAVGSKSDSVKSIVLSLETHESRGLRHSHCGLASVIAAIKLKQPVAVVPACHHATHEGLE